MNEMVIRSSSDNIPLAQSPSITQETKARFNELLNAALSKESVFDAKAVKVSPYDVSKKQSVNIPKVVPRQSLSVKSPTIVQDSKKHEEIFSTYSSDESSENRKVKRQVVAEVHNSRTHLIQSSSEDDILARKKTKKKRKKARWKQVSESAQVMTENEKDNPGFELEEIIDNRSSSRLSNRSYIVETPSFPVENLKSSCNESLGLKKEPDINVSPSRLSNRSYTVETPTFPIEDLQTLARKSDQDSILDLEKEKHSNSSPAHLSNRSYTIEMATDFVESPKKDELSKIKTPIPLPRRKSLKMFEIDQGKTVKKRLDFGELSIENEQHGSGISTYQSNIDDFGPSGVSSKLQDPHSQHTEDDGEMPLAVKKQKRKKKRRKHSKFREEIELQELLTPSEKKQSTLLTVEETQSTSSVKSLIKAAEKLERKTAQSSGRCGIVGVTIHGVDCSLVDPLVRHPMVCLYVIDTSVGEFYHKSEPGRSVCYHGENTDYVLPIMTHPFDFKQHKSVTPAWEECLLLNELLTHLLTPSTLLLFELCDIVPPAVANARHARLGGAAGRHVVAWAFLRPVTKAKTPDLDLRLRLQLYKPGRWPRSIRRRTPVVYEWWGGADRTKYPGSLYVTLSQLDSAAAPLPSPQLRSQSALQPERGSQASTSSTIASAASSDPGHDDVLNDQEATKRVEVVWSRLPGQSCKVPNTRLKALPVEGSMSVQFSGNGLWLACGRQEIQVYSVPQLQHSATLTGHQGLVYCLRWSSDSKILLSASADCTICIWKPFSSRNPLLQMLAHPSFVYCAQFVRPTSLVSGCCDTVVRVWKGTSLNSFQLSQELPGHSGFVSSICVTVDGNRVVSADSQGCLRVYDVEDDGSLSLGRDLRVRELRGSAINNVVTHPGGHRLMVHSRDSTVHSVDLATGAVIHTFKGCTSDRMQTGLCVSPCGSLVLACGEDGAVVVWDGHTGTLRAMYCGLLPPGSAGVHYHPHEHLLALAALSQSPVYILGFNRTATGEDIGLHVFKKEITAADVIETMKLINNSNRWQKATSKILLKSQNSIILQDKVISKEKKKKKEKGINGETNEKQTPSTNWPSLPQLESVVVKSPGEKDLRLLEIIRKMDNIILAAKQSSQPQ